MTTRLKLTVKVVQINRRLAKVLLASSPGNPRGVTRRSLIDKYLAIMKRGDWVVSNPILIDEDGRLLDGHHRLLALIEYGHPLYFAVVEGYIREETKGKLDHGAPRTVASDLIGEKIPRGNLCDAVAKRVLLWEKGVRPPLTRFGGKTRVVTDFERYSMVMNDPDFVATIGEVPNLRGLMPPSASGFSFWLFSIKDRTHAKCFFEDVVKGVGLPDGDPALVLRNKLIQVRLQRRKDRSTIREENYMAWAIKAWNASVRGEKIKRITWQPSERFPEPE